MAHPGNNLKNQFELFDDMISLGIDGVEAFSSYHSPATSFHFYREAKQHSLLVTCGSDYHGKIKPSVFLGCSGCLIDQSEIERQF